MRSTRALLQRLDLQLVPKTTPDLVAIRKATFYKEYPSAQDGSSSTSNPPLFPNLNFFIQATPEDLIGKPARTKHYAVIGANTTPFLKLIQGEYICTPSGARTYPYLSSDQIPEEQSYLRLPSRAIKYVGFNAKTYNDAPGGVKGAYLSARYESRREETDWSLQQYLRGETELNPSQKISGPSKDDHAFQKVVRDLRLQNLIDLPVSHLSNGQTRRSRIAKALLDKPRLLLLDEPFMGLDPPTLVSLSPMLEDLAINSSPRILLGLRPQDPIPYWITHLVYLGANNDYVVSASISQVLFSVYSWMRASRGGKGIGPAEKKMAKEMTEQFGPPPSKLPSLLTPSGVRELDFCGRIWDISHSNRDPDTGLIQLADIKNNRKFLAKNMHQTPDQMTPRMRLSLTTTLSTAALEAFNSALSKLSEAPRVDVPEAKAVEDRDTFSQRGDSEAKRESLIEFSSIVVKYGSKVVLGHEPPQPGYTDPGLNLTISRGTRLLLVGPNGSGKTTLLSLLTSDHPQSYSLPIKFFGRTRLPSPGKPGLSLWQIQSRIGHSSPEVHAFFPKGMNVRQVLESAWSETFSSKPKLTSERTALVDHFLRVWKPELCHDPRANRTSDDMGWASDKIRHPTFGQLPFGVQRLLLLLRAIIKQPDIIVLDEAFSGLPEDTRKKALGWLERGDHSLTTEQAGQPAVIFPGLTDQQALIVVSHVREEVPSCIDEYIRLPSEEEARDDGKTVKIAKTEKGYMSSPEGWNQAWGL